MIDRDWAIAFAKRWISAFNSHEMETIFSLYDEKFTMSSPYFKDRMGTESGILDGKENIRPYWGKSLAVEPPIKFELIDVFTGMFSIVIYYKSIGRKMVSETLTFNDQGKIISGNSQHGMSLSPNA